MDNKRIEHLEVVTQRLMRRASKRTVALITPYPISNAVFGEKVEGAILRYMFPCDGTVTKGFIRLNEKPKKGVNVEVKLFNDIGSTMKGFILDRKTLFIEPKIDVKAGDCLEISLTPSEEIVTGIWISFLWKPEMKDIEVKSYLIEELEDDMAKKEKKLLTDSQLPGGG